MLQLTVDEDRQLCADFNLQLREPIEHRHFRIPPPPKISATSHPSVRGSQRDRRNVIFDWKKELRSDYLRDINNFVLKKNKRFIHIIYIIILICRHNLNIPVVSSVRCRTAETMPDLDPQRQELISASSIGVCTLDFCLRRQTNSTFHLCLFSIEAIRNENRYLLLEERIEVRLFSVT